MIPMLLDFSDKNVYYDNEGICAVNEYLVNNLTNRGGLGIKQLRMILLILALAASGTLLWLTVQKKQMENKSVSVTVSNQIVYTGECTAFDQTVSQKLAGPDAESTIRKTTDFLYELERRWSSDRSDSVISEIAADAGIRPTSLDEEALNRIREGMYYSMESNEYFDITDGPLRRLWNQEAAPAADLLGSACSLIDYTQIQLDEKKSTIFLPRPGSEISMDGLIWGYAARGIWDICQTAELDFGEIFLGNARLAFGKTESGISAEVPVLDRNGKKIGTYAGKYPVMICTAPEYDLQTGMPGKSDLLFAGAVSEDPVEALYFAGKLMTVGSSLLDEMLNNSKIGMIAEDQDGKIYFSDSLAGKFLPEKLQ